MTNKKANMLTLPHIFAQILEAMEEVRSTEVCYDFNAARFFLHHIGRSLLTGTKPTTEAEVGAAVRDAILATNSLAGGGAAGYLAVLELLMISFRADYANADHLVQRYVLRD